MRWGAISMSLQNAIFFPHKRNLQLVPAVFATEALLNFPCRPEATVPAARDEGVDIITEGTRSRVVIGSNSLVMTPEMLDPEVAVV